MTSLSSGKRLSSMEANFLYIETHAAPMHYLLIGLLAGEITFEELAGGIAANVEQLPRFKQKVVPDRFRVRHPTWQPDPLFNIERHLFEVQMAPPGTDDELLALASKIFVGVMDYRKPLWEMYLVHGLSGARAAVIVKMHHSMADGSKALELMKVMVQFPGTPLPHQQASESSNNIAISTNNHDRSSRRTQTPTWGARFSQSARRASFLAGAILKRRRPLPFNRKPSGERILYRCEFSSAEARAIRAAHGGTMSELMLSVLAGGVSRYLEFHKYPTARRSLRVMLSVNLRRCAQDTELSNLACVCPIEIPLSLNDPLERLRDVTAKSMKVREARVAERLDSVLSMLGKVPVPIQLWAAAVSRNRPMLPYNIILTNVSSLRMPQYMFGRRARGIYMFPTIPYSIGVSCGLLEYDEKVNLFLTIDAQAMPDAHCLPVYLKQSFAELRDAAGVTETETLSERLKNEPETSRYELLQEHVNRHVATVLNWHHEQPPDPQQGFFDLGLDSLASLELRDRLQTALGKRLASTLIFDAPNTGALTNYLATEVLSWKGLNGDQPNANPTDTEGPQQLLEKIQHLSDDEVDRLLAKATTSQKAI